MTVVVVEVVVVLVSDEDVEVLVLEDVVDELLVVVVVLQAGKLPGSWYDPFAHASHPWSAVAVPLRDTN